jgi:hypothetical protein
MCTLAQVKIHGKGGREHLDCKVMGRAVNVNETATKRTKMPRPTIMQIWMDAG